jgi:hypothetical protein
LRALPEIKHQLHDRVWCLEGRQVRSAIDGRHGCARVVLGGGNCSTGRPQRIRDASYQ